MTLPAPIPPQPLQYNLLKLYRQHRDEIDTLSDSTTLFILDFTSHYGQVQLDELAGDLGLSPTALKKKIVPLLRGQMVAENDQAISVTALGKHLLDHIDFLPPLAIVSEPTMPDRPLAISEPPPSAREASAPRWLWGLIGVLAFATIVLIGALVVELGIMSRILWFIPR